jgi:hypothetical protein
MQQNIATVLRLQEADHRHLPCHALLPVRGPSRRDPTHPRSCIRPQASAIKASTDSKMKRTAAESKAFVGQFSAVA